MKKVLLMAAAAILAFSGVASAKDIKFNSALTQSQFKDLSKEAGSALSYHNIAASVTLGLTGFDIGVETTAFKLNKSSAYWDAAFNGNAPDYLVIPRLRARKGLPFGIDVGAMYAAVPSSNVKLYGAEISKAILDGGIVSPTIGVRGAFTKLAGVDDIDMTTYSADASISKGFVIVTPYIGAGIVQIESKPKGNLKTLAPTLKSESITQPRYFGGLKLSPIPLIAVTGEVEYAQRPAYSLKLAINF